MRRMPLVLVLLTACFACQPSLEDAFTSGRALNPCVEDPLNVCTRLFSKCTLDNEQYTRQVFPAEFAFVVQADAGSTIEVQIFFAEARDPGLKTEIFWYEPGCGQNERYSSEGRDIFGEADDSLVFAEEAIVDRDGEHPIEIISDMQADVLLSVQVTHPQP